MHKIKKFFIVLLLALMPLHLCCNKKSDPQPGNGPPSTPPDSSSGGQVERPAPTGPVKKLALLVGIDKYRHTNKVSNLAGCVNDVQAMKALLIGKFDFKEENIKILTNEQATHEGIIKAFQDHLIAPAQRGDIVVFHYSGHGSQMKDVSGDEIDGLDETLVCHDSRDPQNKVFDVSDDELNGLLMQLSEKTDNTTFILDSCHSGTGPRPIGALKREVEVDDREPPSTPPAHAVNERGVEGKSAMRAQNANYAAISGCLSTQNSYEYKADGKEHGALTYFLTKELKRTGAKPTYRDVMDNVMGQVNLKFSNQSPQLEGAAGDNYVFSDSTGLAEAYILASPLGNDKVTLNAGEVHGLTVGSVFEVYAPGTKEFKPPQQPIAQVKLTEVTAFASTGARVSGNQIPPFCRAVEREHQYGDLKLLVYYHGLSQSPKLRAIKAGLDSLRFIETVPAVQDIKKARGYHLLLRQDGNQIVTEASNTSEISPRVPANDANAIATVVKQVSQWAKWFNLLSLDNPSSANKIQLRMKVRNAGGTRDPFANLGKAEDTLRVGEQFEFTVENKSGQDFYISILDLSTDGSVTVLYPWAEGAGELLKAGTSMTTQAYEASLPKDTRPDLKSVMDVAKVIATSKPVDLHIIEQTAVKGVETGGTRGLDDPLEQLLGQAALSLSRGAKPAAVKLGDWATDSRVFMVKE